MDLISHLKNNILFFDGGMGTMLQQRGLEPGELPELLNLEQPDIVTAIHREYVEAGSQVITTNTFQAHGLKLHSAEEVEAVVKAGVACAKASGAKWVALDVGPLGQLMQPLGTVSFEQAYEVYRQQVVAGAEAGADLVIIETVSDLYEMKAAVLAVKENTNLPVLCSMTFQDDGRTFVGCDPMTAVITLQGLGVDAVGVNCSLGPAQLHPVVEEMLRYARIPVLVQANAGLPQIRDGETVYDVTPQQYVEHVTAMVDKGVSVVGGCCGTTPEYIRLLRESLAGRKPVARTPEILTACTSGTTTVVLDGRATVIGERLNPTGKKAMKEALRGGDMAYMMGEAIDQDRAGSDALDVNVGLPDIDEPATLAKVVKEVQGVVSIPLQIDSADPDAIEAGVRVYNGKPIINSVNGKKETMEKIFPIVKKYGALVIGLTLDESGIPPTAEERYEIAKNILDNAVAYGIPKEDVLIDCLVLTASAQQEQVMETLKAIQLVKSRLGLKTALGVSNVSFGLPQRELLNATFLAAAFGAGLDAPILNPLSKRYMEVVHTFRVLNNQDRDAVQYIEAYSAAPAAAPAGAAANGEGLPLADIIRQGRREEAAPKVRTLLETTPPLEIIDREFIPALDDVGKRFEKGELFLPQLMQSAQAVQNGFAVIKKFMSASGEARQAKGKVLLATVHGDIHDIGKNIVKMLLENYGFDVVDLGKDVPPEAVVEAIREGNIKLAGLSALMTTTVKSMKDTIAAVREAGLECTFFVGGAVLNEEYAEFVGAEHYCRDAMDSVNLANKFFA